MPAITRLLTRLACCGLLAASSVFLSGAERRFFDDDPLTREPDTQDASKVAEWENVLLIDLATNMFARPGDPTPDVRARDINTIDEVPDSNWFTNRVLARPVSVEEVRRGPNTIDGPAPGSWVPSRGRAEEPACRGQARRGAIQCEIGS